MSTYTVEIQASDANGDIWQALAPAENVTDSMTAEEMARETAEHQNLAEGSGWRVRVWEGADADLGAEPAAEWVAPEGGVSLDEQAMLNELEQAVAVIREQTEQRDELICALMRTSVPRSQIAQAAEVSPKRLYQIRAGR